MTIELRPPLPDVFGALVEVGQPILSEIFAPRCCIAATRVAVDVLAACGYAAHPRPMWARAGNGAFCDALTHDIPVDEWDALGVRRVEIDEQGDDYPAHLVAIVSGHLVDLSAAQFARPAKNILVPPYVILDLPYDWATNREGVGRRLDGGGILVYRTINTELPDYRQAPDWRKRIRTRPAVEATLDAIGVRV